MTTHEPKCVVLKRKGAEHVSKLLAGKTEQEKLKFWQERTKQLLAKQSKSKNAEEVV